MMELHDLYDCLVESGLDKHEHIWYIDGLWITDYRSWQSDKQRSKVGHELHDNVVREALTIHMMKQLNADSVMWIVTEYPVDRWLEGVYDLMVEEGEIELAECKDE